MAVTVSIGVTNQSTVSTDQAVMAWCAAVQHQANYHFAPYWHVGARIHFVKPGVIPTNMAHIAILDDSDQAGALGYHTLDDALKPIASIFAKTDQHYGLSPSVTFSHEVLETLADMMVNDGTQVSASEWYAREVCDATEEDSLGYLVDLADWPPVLVSDFMLPRWFIPGAPGWYDFRHHCSKPLEILPGGYMSVYKSGQWIERTNWDGKIEDRIIPPSELVDGYKRPRPSQEIRRAHAALRKEQS